MTRGQILVGLAVLLSARLAIAATAPVVIVRAERTPPVVADALRRVAAELALHEFSVVTVAAERSPSCALLRVIGDERQAVGAIALA